jgi:hypothetical protein
VTDWIGHSGHKNNNNNNNNNNKTGAHENKDK